MSVWNSTRAGFACILSIAAFTACAAFQREGGASAITDGNIAAMFLAANNTDISYAQVALAPGRTSTAAIRTFANRMLDDHGGLNKAATDLFARTGIVPEDNTISLDFRDESAAKRDTLRERTGAVFDSTYMANEVRYHARLLTVIDSVLIPTARNAELKAMLTGVRPAVAAHLEHAQRVQSGLNK